MYLWMLINGDIEGTGTGKIEIFVRPHRREILALRQNPAKEKLPKCTQEEF